MLDRSTSALPSREGGEPQRPRRSRHRDRLPLPATAGRRADGSEDRSTAAKRWRAFADVVAGALGVNAWISMVLFPALFIGALRRPSHISAAVLPVLVLALGLRRRSEAILLGAFPAALLVPFVVEPQLAAPALNGPVRFGFVAIGVVAYLFGVAFFTTFHEPPEPISVRQLSSAQAAPAPRWRRRERVYWELTIMSLAIPVALIGFVNHDEALAAYLTAMYPGQHAAMTTALTVGALALWLGIYHYAILGSLRPHRTGDRDLVEALNQTRTEVESRALRPRFYAAVALAFVAMVFLVAVRDRG